MSTQQAFGGPIEIQATAQEVERDGKAVRIRLATTSAAPHGGHWRLTFAEPVTVAAGEAVVIETGWPCIDEASRVQPPLVMSSATTVTSVFG